MLTERFGWTGPPDGKQGHYDYVSYLIVWVSILIPTLY